MSLMLEWPWALGALPLPWLAWCFVPAAPRAPRRALKVPFFDSAASSAGATARDDAAAPHLRLGMLAWLCLLLASARPVWHASTGGVSLAPWLLVAALVLSVVLARRIARMLEEEI